MKTNKYSVIKTAALAAMLGACASRAAYADDSSMSRFGGDSYAYFNNQPIDNSPSTWRQANPQGMPERVLQSYSAPGEAWHMTHPVAAAGPSSFRQEHPNGMSDQEYQALSSEGPAWHSGASAPTSMASNDPSGVAQSANKETVAAGSAKIFAPRNATQPDSGR
jgi:hypothetical protein